MNVKVETLAATVLLDDDGREVRVGDAWGQGPAVLVFLRHFGCIFCRENVVDFSPQEAALKKAGARLVFVGLGTPSMAKDFREQMHVTAPIWVDRDRTTYKLLEFKKERSVGALFRPALWKNVMRARLKGLTQTKAQGPQAQYGGVVVIGKAGDVKLAYASKLAGDFPPMTEVLRAAGVPATT